MSEDPKAASLRDTAAYLDSLRNFDTLGQVGKATDIDFFKHAHGKSGTDYFLVLEGKQPGERMDFGQKYAFDSLRKQPNWTVVVVYGTPETGYSLTGSWTGTCKTPEELKGKVDEWFAQHKAL